MSMFIYKGGGGVKNGQNLVYVIKVWPLRKNILRMGFNFLEFFSALALPT